MASTHVPYLEDKGTFKQLIVQGRPFLIRGAELQNSSFSSAKFMQELWPRLVSMNLNTVLGSVTWEMIEPLEGHFDFSEIDRIILDARNAGLKLILLWFGSWKNGISNYVPSWVKLAPDRFPRVWLQGTSKPLKATEIITPLCAASAEADAKAFATLMKHLRELDEMQSTVILVQPENECGILGDSRDRSDIAELVYGQSVPEDLVTYLEQDWDNLHPDLKSHFEMPRRLGFGGDRKSTWAETFGESPYTDELFMAYHYARYVDTVARAGKKEYPLPMFCNFWQNYNGEGSDNDFPVLAGGGGMPGDYPSGGGISNVLDIWMHFATAIDFISPDVYLNDYTHICQTYRHRNQPLFIPEQRRDEYGARRLWKAIGSYHAIGACPFGVDSLAEGQPCAYTRHFELLAYVSELVLEAQQRPGAIVGFFFDEIRENTMESEDPSTVVEMGGYRVTIERSFVTGRPGPGYGIVILHQENKYPNDTKFLLIGQGFQAVFESLDPRSYYTGILKFEEQEFNPSSGKLDTLRRLNGDETRSGQFVIMPNDDPDYAGFPISITIPARTRIAECSIYSLLR
ncbi:hypothetical protein Forpi1262_v016810 [Fusarium oxysporum f. sp. raphani]|uniref:Beta-galactosidase n=1 Tax=Fusarium oxysporum f. sp. raphani TaxID=96318 RepID=A0A8J5TXW2_FUSOX|nr:hypothetical protein Forpi1262_v016810 [Fusarium oxysporum f. sp. raphani]